MVKKFVYDGTTRQQKEVLCYAFSPDLINATYAELEELLSVIWMHFPRTETTEGPEPIFLPELSTPFNLASENVQSLMSKRREEIKHKKGTTLQYSILAVSCMSLLVSTEFAALNYLKDKSPIVFCQSQGVQADTSPAPIRMPAPTQKRALPKQ